MNLVENSKNGTWTVEEVANYLRCSKRTVLNMIRSKRLVAYKLGRALRIPGVEVEKLKTNRVN